MAVSEQVHFVMTGFAFQLFRSSMSAETKVHGRLVTKSHLKLDALPYTWATWKAEILTQFCRIHHMNVMSSLLMKECSTFAFVLAGLVKEVALEEGLQPVNGTQVVRPASPTPRPCGSSKSVKLTRIKLS